jgi:hypothetical protein
MPQTEKFRRQHDELLKIAQLIGQSIDLQRLSGDDAVEVSKNLGKLSAVLLVHLTLEDSSLYPRLERHADEAVRSMAHDYKQTMGGLKATFESYVKRWPAAVDIEKNPAQFSVETKGILEALGARIDKENNGLYSLVDRLEIQLSVA